MNHCCSRVNSKNNYKPKCKNPINLSISDRHYCWIHASKEFSIQSTTIQRIFRGHYYRGKMKRLFINLPRDCQTIVLKYLKATVYYTRYTKVIQVILDKKYNTLLNIYKAHNINNLYNLTIDEHINRLRIIKTTFGAYYECITCAPFNNLISLYHDIENNGVIFWYLYRAAEYDIPEMDILVREIKEIQVKILIDFDGY
jgi:hypothetical protein